MWTMETLTSARYAKVPLGVELSLHCWKVNLIINLQVNAVGRAHRDWKLGHGQPSVEFLSLWRCAWPGQRLSLRPQAAPPALTSPGRGIGHLAHLSACSAHTCCCPQSAEGRGWCDSEKLLPPHKPSLLSRLALSPTPHFLPWARPISKSDM